MNLSTLLNDESEGANKPTRRPSGPYSRQAPLPALRTESYRSPGGPPSRQSSFESQNPALLHSPAIQRLARPDLAYQNPYSPGGSVVYPQNNTPLSPYTTSSISPGNAHPYGNRPSSHPSAPSTPSSTHAQTPHTYHESPVPNYPYQAGVTSYTHNPISQPGTPLGPPNGPFRLPSHSNRESPSILNALQSPSSGNHGNAAGLYRPPPQSSISHIVNAPTTYNQTSVRDPSPTQVRTSEPDDRERSVSVSPKTVVTALPPRLNSVPPRGYKAEGSSSPVRTESERRLYPMPGSIHKSLERDHYQTGLPESTSSIVPPQSAFLVDPLQQRYTNPSTPEMPKKQLTANLNNLAAQMMRDNSVTPGTVPATRVSNGRMAEPSSVTTPILIESPEPRFNSLPSTQGNKLKRAHQVETIMESSATPPPSKRRRFANIPVWAQQCKHTNPLPKYRKSNAVNGGNHARPNRPLPRTAAQAQSAPEANNGLEVWEPTFTNIIPHDEITKMLCDFLFTHIVTDESLQTRSSGNPSNGEALVEIEAKLGTIVDRSTNQRMILPILTETILHQDANVAFESMMTVEQHKMFNEKLNEEIQRSRGPPNPKARIPISYNHTNEKDSFYELPASELASLPPSVRSRVGARKPRLRVTRDAKTGNIIAQIIKVRIADLHVLSPRTLFDWRVSISAEINWNGDVQRLMASAPQDMQRNGMPDRIKDRMSYKHQFCQIDLTQVKPNTSAGVNNATHELEVELDATMVRQQGMAARNCETHRYEELVRIFANNVRTLAKALG